MAQFFNVCSNIAKHVALSALEIIIPSLARRLGEDPQLLVASEQSRGNITVLGSSPDNPSVIYIEDDEDVIVLNNGGLTKVAPKAGSRSPLRSCESPNSSRSSCGKRYVLPLPTAWQIDDSDRCLSKVFVCDSCVLSSGFGRYGLCRLHKTFNLVEKVMC